MEISRALVDEEVGADRDLGAGLAGRGRSSSATTAIEFRTPGLYREVFNIHTTAEARRSRQALTRSSTFSRKIIECARQLAKIRAGLPADGQGLEATTSICCAALAAPQLTPSMTTITHRRAGRAGGLGSRLRRPQPRTRTLTLIDDSVWRSPVSDPGRYGREFASKGGRLG